MTLGLLHENFDLAVYEIKYILCWEKFESEIRQLSLLYGVEMLLTRGYMVLNFVWDTKLHLFGSTAISLSDKLTQLEQRMAKIMHL